MFPTSTRHHATNNYNLSFNPIAPVGTLEECMGSTVQLPRPLVAQAILFIVVLKLGPISPLKLILGVTT
ncbi:hypothetical protein E2C01_024987 [Portunus trituberculatus]|uniref:Uncharacterized protein n=1 Tax=Portunus trituberculatus TaxID=210409 RepID=A0A5B7EC15_PORTR|nr:hypothetical protein [Portunus trituberculatus]